jgi:hypothetical protein
MEPVTIEDHVTFDDYDSAAQEVWDKIQIDLDNMEGDVDRYTVEHMVASAIQQLEGELFFTDEIRESFNG